MLHFSTRVKRLLIQVSAQSLIFNGRLRKDGTLATLSPSDQQKIIVGRDRLINRSLKISHILFLNPTQIPIGSCQGEKGSCDIIRSKFFTHYSPHTVEYAFQSAFFIRFLTYPAGVERLCRNCESWLLDRFKNIAWSFWKDLPSIFDLTPWDQLAGTPSSADAN